MGAPATNPSGSRTDLAGQIERWRLRTLQPFLGRHPLRRPAIRTRSGLPIQDVYTPMDVEGDEMERRGLPGEYPYTRGISPSMYRSDFWTMGQYAGYGSVEDTNRRFRHIIGQGGTGFSIALDLPTQIGYDADHRFAQGEVGKVGVSINSLRDMEVLLDGVRLTEVRQIRTTANAIGPIMLALFICVADKQGLDPVAFNVLLQNDPLKEYIGRGTYICPPRPAVRLVADVMEYCATKLPNWTAVNVSGYHIRESGATAVQEVALTFTHAREYIEAALARGLSIDSIAPGIWVFFSVETDLLEEVAKFRAARRLWAQMMKERYGAERGESMQLKVLSFTAGSTFTAQQPLNNVVRATIQSLAATLGGTQTLHCSSYDEALGLPTQEAVTLSLRTQQIVAEESGVANVVDPLGGSYYVEALTDRIAAGIQEEMSRFEQVGGAVAAIESGYSQKLLGDAAYAQQRRIESGEATVVGVNAHTEGAGSGTKTFSLDEEMQERAIAGVRQVRRTRDAATAKAAMVALRAAVHRTENLVPAIVEAVRSYCTVGEICDVLRAELGAYVDPGFLD